MPASGRIYYIVGAGIAGLTLALALGKTGATAIVLERSASLSEFGAGLQIGPNARRVLDGLGLGEAIAARSFEPSGIDIYPAKAARPLVTLALGQAMRSRFGAPYAVMHRADLADVLYKACRRFANIDINFGLRDWDAASHARGVTLTLDEADGQTRTVRGDALIGADGVHSLTRRKLLDGPDAQSLGRTAWRTLLPIATLGAIVARDRVSVLLGKSHHLVCYPLPHRDQFNVALFAATARDAEAGPQISQPDDRLAAILALAGDSWTPWPLYTVSTPLWHRGHVGLIGDAAHAMVPFQAQGAAMAIEDAAVLASLLAANTDAETAFADFAERRRPRVERVARQSRDNGRIFHLGWPAAQARNLVIAAQGSHGHLGRLAWLYGHDALSEALAS